MTTLPRQRDHVFGPKNGCLLLYVFIRCCYFISTPRLKFFLYFSCPWCSITYVVALSLSRSYIIVTCPAPILRPHFNAVSARVPCNWIHNFLSAITTSVVEPFHFGQAPPAPASQDGGSSSSPVVHNLLLKKKLRKFSLLNLPACFIHRNVRVLCFALSVLYLQ